MSSRPAETSIIIRTYNEQRDLPALFDALDLQRYRDFEVIVVDSGSFDRTREVAVDRGAKLIRIEKHDFTFGYSLNTGIRAAAGRFAVAVSAHTVPAGNDWLANLVKPLRDDPNTAMSYGRQIGVPSSKFSEAEDFERLFGAESRTDSLRDIRANNANSAIRRDLWLRHPFDESLPGLEDVEWARNWLRQNFQVVYVPDAPIHHIHEESWQQVENRYYREAVAARQMGVKLPSNVLKEVWREIFHAVGDWRRLFFMRSSPVLERLTRAQSAREVLYFRWRKLRGTLRGLTQSHAMESREEQESILFDKMSRAVIVKARGTAVLEEVPVPEIKPGEVLIRVAHVAVCATDIDVLDGRLGYFENGMSSYPIIPGHEFSGWVAARGQNVNGIPEGSPVVVEPIQSCGVCEYCAAGNQIACADRREIGVMSADGAYANYIVTPARFVHRLPPEFDMRLAALVEPTAVVLKGLRRLGLGKASPARQRSCAVIGSGSLGHICAKAVHELGHAVTGFDRNDERNALLRVDGISTSRDLSDLGQFDTLIEVTGSQDVLEAAIRYSRPGAQILLLGFPYAERDFSFEQIVASDKSIIGSVGSNREDFEAAIGLLPKLGLRHHLACELSLGQFDEAWKLCRTGRALKVILTPEWPETAAA